MDYIIVYQNLEIKSIINEIINIKHTYMNVEIILIYSNLSDSENNSLKRNGIHKIIDEKKLKISDIKELLENNKIIKYVKPNIEINEYNNKFLNKIITIYGTEKSGKTTFAINIAKVISRKASGKILILDIDILDSDLDKILNINEESVLMKFSNELMKQTFNERFVENNITKFDKKIDILTGNTSIFNCQNILNVGIYEEIFKTLKNKYETVIIDTNSNIFLDSTKWALEKADTIFYTFECRINDAIKADKYYKFLISNWCISKEKIKFIITKCTLNSKNVISQIFNESVEGWIKYNKSQVNSDSLSTSFSQLIEYEKIIYKKSNLKEIVKIVSNKMKGIQNDY